MHRTTLNTVARIVVSNFVDRDEMHSRVATHKLRILAGDFTFAVGLLKQVGDVMTHFTFGNTSAHCARD